MATQADVKTDSTPIFVVAAVGDAIFDELCPGVRFTPEDDERYAAAARAALKACHYQDIAAALELAAAVLDRAGVIYMGEKRVTDAVRMLKGRFEPPRSSVR